LAKRTGDLKMTRTDLKKWLFLTAILFISIPMTAQNKLFTLEDLNWGGNNFYNLQPKNLWFTWWGDELMYLDAEEGDIISNLEEGFSVFTAGKWVGDLKALRPGQGYMYKSQGRKGFVYNSVPTVNARAIYGKRVEQRECPWEVNVHKYADMMCIIANVYEVDTPVGREDWVVGAFVGDECRGIGHFIGNELILPVRGKEGDELTFTLLSLTVDLGSDLKEHPAFTADAVGTMVEPLRLSFSEADAIHSVNGSGLQPEGAVYDLTGRRVNYQLSTINYQLKKGIYVINGKKLLRK
jgi:hypothetical protein